MIIKCPDCETSFVVPDESLAPKGRKVRCGSCKTQWFQKYPPPGEDGTETGDDDSAFLEDAATDNEDTGDLSKLDDADSDNENFDDIPDGVKPNEDTGNDVDIPASKSARRMARTVNYGYALILFAVIFGGFSISSAHIIPIWPASAIYYDAIGVDTAIPGEQLAFDRINARISLTPDRDMVLSIQGNLLNLRGEKSLIPNIQFDLQQEDGTLIKTLPLSLSEPYIEGEASLNLENQYKQSISPLAKTIKLYFYFP